MKIRSLSEAEKKYITEALRLLFISSTAKSTARWAADVMLQNDANFVQNLMWIEKE